MVRIDKRKWETRPVRIWLDDPKDIGGGNVHRDDGQEDWPAYVFQNFRMLKETGLSSEMMELECAGPTREAAMKGLLIMVREAYASGAFTRYEDWR